MRKIIKEILGLLWKLFRIFFWKWIKPILGKLAIYGLIAVAIIGVIVFFILSR